jgi:SAM-dependent methyltransferase
VTFAVFRQIYETNLWGFGSGHGARPHVTKGYRAFIENFIRENSVTTVVDFGCGDWQFSHLIDWAGVDYLGLDVVPELIHQNQERYGNRGIAFALSPDRLADVPCADLLLVKHVLQHWPTRFIQDFMIEVVPRFRFALITNSVDPRDTLNSEIAMGEWRPLDLRLAPYGYDVPPVFSFEVPAVWSWRKLRKYPAGHETVLLFSQHRRKHSGGPTF